MDKQKIDINFKLCLVFQEEDLVKNPTSYDKLVAAVKERASCGSLMVSQDDDDLYFALFTLNLHYICRSKL